MGRRVGCTSPIRHASRAARRGIALSVALLTFGLTIASAQVGRMAIEGSIQLDGSVPPAGTVIRLLRPDGSIARSVLPYPSNASQFALRINTREGWADGIPLGFRVVLSRRDSFEARCAGQAPVFHGTVLNDPPVERVLLYRN